MSVTGKPEKRQLIISCMGIHQQIQADAKTNATKDTKTEAEIDVAPLVSEVVEGDAAPEPETVEVEETEFGEEGETRVPVVFAS